MHFQSSRLITLVSLLGLTSAADILKLSDFQDCTKDADIKLNSVDIQYNANTKAIDFSVDGTSTKSEKVRAVLNVQAYGKQVYTKEFNPCDESNPIPGLCPGKSFAVISSLLGLHADGERQFLSVDSVHRVHKPFQKNLQIRSLR